ncbi:MAG: cytochrome c [Myxococcota bacterium]
MRRVLKWVGITVATLTGVLGVVMAVTNYLSLQKINHVWDVQPQAIQIPDDAVSQKEGQRLFGARGCAKCHGEDGAGVLILDNPLIGTLWGANLTPGEGGVVRNYTGADWVRTVRHGIKPNGYPLQVMDSKEYQYMSDRDLGLIVSFIRSLPPVSRATPPQRISVLSHMWHGLGLLEVTTADQVDHQRRHDADPPPGATPEFGKHLLRLQCQGCHGDGLSGGKLTGAPGLPIPPTSPPTWRRAWGAGLLSSSPRSCARGVVPTGACWTSSCPGTPTRTCPTTS